MYYPKHNNLFTPYTKETYQTLIDQFYKLQTPFVFYRKAASKTLKAVIQEDDTLYTTVDYSESGFVLAPFDNQMDSILFPFSKSEFLSFDLLLPDTNTFPISHRPPGDIRVQNDYLTLLQKAIDFIKEGHANKIVISRKISQELKSVKPADLFVKILNQYPDAFVSIWFHPAVGLWMGASPEKLLNQTNDVFSTMSLAGTKLKSDKREWNKKEKEEQQWVTDFIINQLLPMVDDLQVSKPKTVTAAHLNHIKSDITGRLSADFKLNDLIKALHPTPAVCGTPRKIAQEFILENENYNRDYYTGFLGELNMENQTDLYVNLRCLQIQEQKVRLYVGGGITKDSNPEDEWEETLNKSGVLGRFL